MLARKVLKVLPGMDNANHVPQSETAARRVGSTKARRGRPRKKHAQENVVPEPAAVETVADETVADETVPRERSLLRATLRVWELKHRTSE